MPSRYVAPAITAAVVFAIAVQTTSVPVAIFAAFIGALVTLGLGTRTQRDQLARRRDKR